MNKPLTKEIIEKEYISSNRTMKEVSRYLGISPQTLCSYIKKLNIKSKPSNWKGKAWNSGITYKEDKRILAKDKHPRYKGGKGYCSDFHHLRSKLLPNKCEICNKEGELLHHKDKNKNNNNIKNIQVLCFSCHTRLHDLERGRIEKIFKCAWCGKEKTLYSNNNWCPECCSLKCKSLYQYHIKKNSGIYIKNNKDRSKFIVGTQNG